jgi:signal transduction histidine kinase
MGWFGYCFCTFNTSFASWLTIIDRTRGNCGVTTMMTHQAEKGLANRPPKSALRRHETKPVAFRQGDELTQLGGEFLLAQPEIIENSVELEKQKNERLQELGMVVHGLRNPACSILSAMEYLVEDAANALTEEQMTLLRGVAQSSACILRMIENILDFSEFECGKLTMNFTPSDLISLAKQVVTLNRPQAERRGVRLETHFDSRALIVDLDPNKITQVIDNLIGNAIKFSHPDGKIDIRISTDKAFVLISISDEGPGIRADRIKTIFEPFQRGHNRKESPNTGAGLGLAISKRMVELHSGAIAVRSEVGIGSTFTVKLPTTQEAQGSLSCSRAKNCA